MKLPDRFNILFGDKNKTEVMIVECLQYFPEVVRELSDWNHPRQRIIVYTHSWGRVIGIGTTSDGFYKVLDRTTNIIVVGDTRAYPPLHDERVRELLYKFGGYDETQDPLEYRLDSKKKTIGKEWR